VKRIGTLHLSECVRIPEGISLGPSFPGIKD